MTYLNDEFWVADIKIDKEEASSFHYKYILRHEDGEIIPEFGKDRLIDVPKHGVKEVQLIDTWNHAGEYENAFLFNSVCRYIIKKTGFKIIGKV
jgi:4-alpha-glucanotransferase